jgi:Methyltransferase domain
MNESQQSGPRYASKLPAELLKNCRVLADQSEILPLIPKGKIFCEIGVALGDFSERILATCAPRKFYAMDLFDLHDAPQMWDGRVGRELNGMRHAEYYRSRFRNEIKSGVMEIMVGDSVALLEKMPPRCIDIFYINADHSYISVRNELRSIKAKAAPGAWIIANDYTMADWLTNIRYGVVQAAHEFMIEDGWEMIYLALHTAMFCVVVLRKIPAHLGR